MIQIQEMREAATPRVRPLRKSMQLAACKDTSKHQLIGCCVVYQAPEKLSDQPAVPLICSETPAKRCGFGLPQSASHNNYNPPSAKIAPIMLRVVLSAVIIGSSHGFCPATRSVCQRPGGVSAEPVDAVGDDAPVPTSETTSDLATTATAAAAGATVASTVVTAAGTVCATGACTAAGAAAGTAGAGLLSQLAYPIAALGLSGALALQSGPEALMDQAAHSALYADAMRSNHPVVLEFYSNDCRHCRHAASSLAETAAAHPGTDWVMVDCQKPESRSLVEKYNVGPIPHFAFLDESKTLRRTETGESGARRADAVLRALEGSSS